jgi:hypothetical protein
MCFYWQEMKKSNNDNLDLKKQFHRISLEEKSKNSNCLKKLLTFKKNNKDIKLLQNKTLIYEKFQDSSTLFVY